MKEWLSDNLRYLILVLIILLAIGSIILGVELYQGSHKAQEAGTAGDEDAIVIYTESGAAETEKSSEKITEGETQKEAATEKTSEKTTEKSSETAKTDATGTQNGTAAGAVAETSQTAGAAANTGNTAGDTVTTADPSSAGTQTTETQAPETEPPTEIIETEPVTEVYEPVYMTMTGACYIRSYADYGDNIIGEYPAGTVVEFLEDVGGWYKVQIDGMVGYMGARFFQ